MKRPSTALTTLTIIGILTLLSGCVELERSVVNNQIATPPPSDIMDSLPQICQAAKDNRVSANDFYNNKGLSVSGNVMSINEGYKPRYRVYLKAGNIHVHAGTENQVNVKQLTVGRKATVDGTITDVSYDYQGCSIALKDASF